LLGLARLLLLPVVVDEPVVPQLRLFALLLLQHLLW
jgi:hypothetical protein